MNFDEAYYKLDEIINVLVSSINNDNIFENIFNFSERNNILSYFQNLDSHIINIKN
jgi:hypothetical protein